jgi:hypothetical protein
LEQKALTGQTLLSPEDLLTVTGGGVLQNQLPGAAAAPKTQTANNAAVSNNPLIPVRATEFGEVDRPSRGGYTEPNWNVGAWGHNLEGFNNQGVALPSSVLARYGYSSKTAKTFGSDFNSKYDIQVIDPKTGKATVTSLKDVGPGAKTGAGLDLLGGDVSALGLPRNSSHNLQYRVVPKGSALPDKTTQVAASAAQGNGAAGGDQGAGGGSGPVYVQPVDRSTLKTPSGRSDLSTQDEMNIAKAKMEDYITNIEQGGGFVTQKDYNEHFDHFYAEAHALNTPPVGQRVVSASQFAEQPTTTTTTTPAAKSIFQNPATGDIEPTQPLTTTTTTAPPPVKMPYQGMPVEEQNRYARSVTGQWVKSLGDTGVDVTQDQAKQFYDGALGGAQKIAIGVPVERLPSATGDRFASLFTGIDNLNEINRAQNAFKNTKWGAVATVTAPEAISGRPLPQWMQSDEYKNFDAARNRSIGGFVSGLAGSNRLSEEDIHNVKAWLPNEMDTPAQAKQKTLSGVAEHLRTIRHEIDVNNVMHYDTGNLEQQYQQYRKAYLDAGGATTDLTGEPVQAPQGNPQTMTARKDALTADLNKQIGYTPPPPTTPPADQNKPIDLSAGQDFSKSPAPTPPVDTSGPTTSGPPIGSTPMEPVTAESVGSPSQEQQDQQNQQNVLSLF